MSSETQKKSGYPLPEGEQPTTTVSFCITIPNDPAFRNAMYAQLTQLGKWWNWKRDPIRDTAATESAMTWRELFTLAEDCGEPMSCEEVEDCLESSAIIEAMQAEIDSVESSVTTINTSLTEVIEEVDTLQENVTQTNVVPPISDYEGDSICNASDYIATKILELALQTWEDSGDLTVEEFLVAMLELQTGFVGEFLTSLFESANPADTDTPDELEDARQYLVKALYCNNLDRTAARNEIAASGSITTAAKDLIVAVFDSLTDAKYSLWAFVGDKTVTGICSCDNIKIWDFSLGSQLGWVPQGGNRAAWLGNGWGEVNLGYGNITVIERAWTWPTDLVLTSMSFYIENHSPATYQLFYGMPYVNGAFTVSSFGVDGFQYNSNIVKGSRDGMGIEYSIQASTTSRLYKVVAEYTGTPPSDW